MDTTTIPMADMTVVQQKAAAMLKQAREVAAAITTDQGYQMGAEYLRKVKSYRNWVDGLLGPAVKAAYDAWKKAGSQRKLADDPADEAERIVKAAMGEYKREQDRKAMVEQQRLAAESRKREEDARLAAAVQAEKAGNDAQAKAIVSAPIVPVMTQAQAAPKADGVSHRVTYKAEVYDFKALVAAVAAGQVPLAALKPDPVVIGQQARSLKTELNWPGVKVTAENTVSVRSEVSEG